MVREVVKETEIALFLAFLQHSRRSSIEPFVVYRRSAWEILSVEQLIYFVHITQLVDYTGIPEIFKL